LHWISGSPPQPQHTLAAKIRYRQTDQACHIRSLDGCDCEVEFERSQRAATAGQSIVFYDGEDCLGGGIVESARQRHATEAVELIAEEAE